MRLQAFCSAFTFNVAVAFCFWLLAAQGAEFRGLWVDAFHGDFTNAANVKRLLGETRSASCNALFVEIRRRGDAFYNSSFEPKASELAADFDPLAKLIAEGHDTSKGPRVEIHAWIITYPVWRGEDGVPPQRDHPFYKHPDWFTQGPTGDNYDGHNFVFDPGHPEVQKYLFNVAMDILSRYEVDGFVFDYVGYTGNKWGYNTNAVSRFNRLFARAGQPKSTDPDWLQFRRDQVSALLRKTYLSAMALKPQVKISAATITWPPAPSNDAEWYGRSSAYNIELQDWRAWMEEGIVDMNIPMLYYRDTVPNYAACFRQWARFAKERRYNRHVVIAPAIYMNTVSNTINQIRLTREQTPKGGRAEGVCLFSYADYSAEKVSRETFSEALTHPTHFDPNPEPVFAQPASTPEMPWKANPAAGHLKGVVSGASSTNALDGATLRLSGPKTRTLKTDATGFYGAVDLPVGSYTLVASFSGYHSMTNTFSVTAGKVTTQDILLGVSAPGK